MINKKLIARITGMLLCLEAGLLLLCSLFPLLMHEGDLMGFVSSVVITAVAGVLFLLLGKGAERQLSRKDGYVIVSITWVVFSLFGMLPYYLSGYIPSIHNAFFETMSGFTTTGATILNNIEALPHGLLFWRSMTQWIGGLGIVFFTLAVLPIFGAGGIQLFAAEATGVKYNKLHPRIGVTAKWIWSLYLLLTILGATLLWLGGVGWFDSICHALTTTATGGFSTKQESIAAFHSAYVEYVTIFMMFVGGINFTLLFSCIFQGKVRTLVCDTEFRWYYRLLLGFTAVVAVILFVNGATDVEQTIRQALFQVVSLQTTTGYSTANYMLWHPSIWLILSVVMYFGACAGSTTGAIKCIRIAILSQIAKNQFKRILHPNAVLPIRINKQVLPQSTQSTLLAFVIVYVIALFMGWMLLMLMGETFIDAYGIVVSCLSNIGPALGYYGPAETWESLNPLAKWFCSFLMLIGRLELFSVLLLFTKSFWKQN